MSSAPLRLSAEQLAVVRLATNARGDVTVVTAGAGTGKTTTLMALAERFNELGRKPTYVTFSKKGADDAQERLGHRADCRTLDSIAWKLVVKGYTTDNPLMDYSVDKLILEICGHSIDGLLEPAVELLGRQVEVLRRQGKIKEASRESRKSRGWRRTVGFFIRKTLERFLYSADSAEVGLDAKEWNTTFFPAQKWHTNAGKDGAPVGVRCDYRDFYVTNAKKVWFQLRPWISKSAGGKGGKQWTYATAFKEMQLRGTQLPPGTPILCDESQDMNECQVQWVMQQRNARSVFFVGDAVQTIYQFRGAHAKVSSTRALALRGAKVGCPTSWWLTLALALARSLDRFLARALTQPPAVHARGGECRLPGRFAALGLAGAAESDSERPWGAAG
jgi:hypothetical protein